MHIFYATSYTISLTLLFFLHLLWFHMVKVDWRISIAIIAVRLFQYEYYCTLQFSYTLACSNSHVRGKYNPAIQWQFCFTCVVMSLINGNILGWLINYTNYAIKKADRFNKANNQYKNA